MVDIERSHVSMRYENPDLEKYRNEVWEKIKEFLGSQGIKYVIGISGDADPSSKVDIRSTIEEFVSGISDLPCAIQTGGTKYGVPELGLDIANDFHLPTIGVFPEQGRKYALYDRLDFAVETYAPTIGDPTFGTETPSFAQLLDGATVVGGSFGTLTEVSTILKTSGIRMKAERPPIYLAPIAGTGGVADAAYGFASMDTKGVVSASMPDVLLDNGTEAAAFLRDRLLADAEGAAA